MNKPVIAFYPGAGGHRLMNSLLGVDYTAKGITYDNYSQCHLDNRYLYKNFKITVPTSTVLTHCIDIDLIRKIIPNRNIILIESNYKDSLRRHWVLFGKKLKQKDFVNELDNAYTFIRWHDQYYTEYPAAGVADQTINILKNNDDFSNIMRHELDITDKIFDAAWEIYHQYGANAPIIDLYKEMINAKK